MPDDERLGGTRDPHEHGRRHRREGEQEPQQPRRRRRSVDAGGVSVADLVQRHTGSRPDLTPVNPDQLRQNSTMTGRRARQDDPPQGRPSAEPRPPSIAAALDGTFPADEPPTRRPAGGGNGFPRDEAPRRAGGTSSYYTIPSEALRDSVAKGPSVPDEAPHRAGETSAYYGLPEENAPNGFPPDAGTPRRRAVEPRGDFPPDAAGPRRARRAGETSGPRNAFPPPTDPAPRRAGETSAYYGLPEENAPNGFPRDDAASRPAPEAGRNGTRRRAGDDLPAPDAPGRRVGEGSGPRNGFPRDEASARAGHPPAADPNGGFPPDAAPPRPSPRRRSADAGRPNEAPANAFPPDAEIPRRGAPRRAGEASARMPFPADNGFPPDADGPHPGSRRAGEASAHHNLPGEAPRTGRRGEASAQLPFPADGGFPPDPDAPHPGSRRTGEASLPNGTRNGRRPGETSAAMPFPADTTFPADPDTPHPGGRRTGEALPKNRRNGRHGAEPSAPVPYPGDTDTPHPGGHRPGEASLPNNGRRAGETSAPMPFPADGAFPPDTDAPHPGGRRTGDASLPKRGRRNGRRAGEASAAMPFAADGAVPPDTDAPHPGGRRPGETSAPMPFPADAGFPTDPDTPHPGSHRTGEAPLPNGTRNGRRPGETSAPMPFPPDPDAPHPGGRRVGEASLPNVARRAGDADGPHNGRRPGEASAHLPFPGDVAGEPEPRGNRPEGAARRRAARGDVPRSEPGPRPFPPDAPALGLFPGDDPQQPPAPAAAPRRSTGVPAVPLPPPRRGEDDDPISMTTEMEAIGEEVQKRRSIDHTLARFSAVHDEIKAEEREKKAKRRKLMPWQAGDDEMDRLDELEAQQSMAMAIPKIEPRDEEEDIDPKKAKKKRRWRKGRSAGKAFAIVIAALVFVSTAVAWGFRSYIESSAQTVDALDPDSDAIKDAAAQLGDENFLLVGSDTRAGATAEDGVGDANSVQGARSDTVMIAHIPKNRERVVVVSFPRDLEVTRPACEGWDPTTGKYTGEQHPAEEQVKLNSAYQVGGPKCVTKVIQELSGLAINHFVGIDFHGFKDMVEAVQGVEVCVERPLEDEVLGMIVPEAGKNVKLTGDQALNFVRARKVKGDVTADYGRIIRQQRFLSSLLRKAMSSEVLLDPGKLTKFVDAFSKATFGDNIGIEQLFTLGQSMQGVEAGRVTFITVPTIGYQNDRGNEDLRVEDNNALFEAIRQDTPLPGETPAKSQNDGQTQAQAQGKQQMSGLQQGQATAPADPKTIKIQVMNGGNDTPRIAGDTADELAEFGFQIMQVNSAPPVDKTVIRYSKTREAEARTLKAAVPGATLVEDPSMSGAIMLVIGPDFDGTVQSPTGGTTQPTLPDNLSTVNAGDVSCA